MNEKEARKRVKELRDFYSHLATYLLVNVFLIALNLITSPGALWFVWPLMGWGIGLLSHAASVFGLFGIGTKGWEERKLQELMLQDAGRIREEVRGAVAQELRAKRPADVDLARLVQRIEHLEAIVTSRDWDLLEADYRAPLEDPEAGDDTPAAEAQAAENARKAAALARRAR